MSLLPPERPPALARFRTVSPGERIEVQVHFNPASLQYTLANQVEPAPGGRTVQYVSQTTAKLSMDLVFDTTHTGHDVREETLKMARLLQPHGPSGRRVPPLVEFSWGTYGFRGTVEQYRETLDFFSPEGVPLRSSISLTLSTTDATFSADTSARTDVDQAAMPAQGGPAGAANALGRPGAARAIAALNGSASLRFSAGAELAVGASAGVQLQAAAAFSAGATAGFNVGAGAGIGLGGGSGFSLGTSAGAGFGAAALSSSAGASVGLGADFSGLRTQVAAGAGAALPDARTVLSLTSAPQAQGGAFGVGGQLQGGGSASLAVDVSGDGDGGLNARLKFGP